MVILEANVETEIIEKAIRIEYFMFIFLNIF